MIDDGAPETQSARYGARQVNPGAPLFRALSNLAELLVVNYDFEPVLFHPISHKSTRAIWSPTLGGAPTCSISLEPPNDMPRRAHRRRARSIRLTSDDATASIASLAGSRPTAARVHFRRLFVALRPLTRCGRHGAGHIEGRRSPGRGATCARVPTARSCFHYWPRPDCLPGASNCHRQLIGVRATMAEQSSLQL